MPHDYAPSMHHLPRPRSTTFRIVLAMALLAWTTLAFGAMAVTPRMQGAMGAVAQNTAVHCDGMPMQHADSRHHQPAAPMGHGDCCHGGCHCLSACNAVLTVPGLRTAAAPLQASPVFLAQASHVRAPSAPPLRPPIA